MMMTPRAASAEMSSVAKPEMAFTPQRKALQLHSLPNSKAGTPSGISHKATDETLSTTNCDDSLTASVNMSATRLYAPPVFAVNVDKRNVRQRLRDQEAKIAALLQTSKSSTSPTASVSAGTETSSPHAGASDEILLKLVQALEQDLKKVEGEKNELKEQLAQVEKQKATIDEDEDIDSMKDVEVVASLKEVEVVAAQDDDTTTVTALKDEMARLKLELRRKTHESLLLQDRWENTLQRMVQYQIDLETHDVHYTDYATRQFQLGNEALQEIKEMTKKDQPPETRQLGKQAKHMMSTLLKDLEVMGERYQESRVNQEVQLAHWKQKQLEWQHKAEVLEETLQEYNIEIPENVASITAPSMSGPLMKFHEKLRLQQTAAMQSHDDLYAQSQAAKQEAEAAQLERSVLQEEVKRLQQTVTQLQSLTRQQQDTLQEAAAAAAAAVSAAAADSKKKKNWNPFGKKKKQDKPPPPPVVIPPPLVNLTASLAPMQGESTRFEELQGQVQSQSEAFKQLHEAFQKQAKQNAQLQQTITDLRMEQHAAAAKEENRALNDLQALFDDLQLQRRKEQMAAEAELEQIRSQLGTLNKPNI